MIAAVIALRKRRAPEFSAPDNQRLFATSENAGSGVGEKWHFPRVPAERRGRAGSDTPGWRRSECPPEMSTSPEEEREKSSRKRSAADNGDTHSSGIAASSFRFIFDSIGTPTRSSHMVRSEADASSDLDVAGGASRIQAGDLPEAGAGHAGIRVAEKRGVEEVEGLRLETDFTRSVIARCAKLTASHDPVHLLLDGASRHRNRLCTWPSNFTNPASFRRVLNTSRHMLNTVSYASFSAPLAEPRMQQSSRRSFSAWLGPGTHCPIVGQEENPGHNWWSSQNNRRDQPAAETACQHLLSFSDDLGHDLTAAAYKLMSLCYLA